MLYGENMKQTKGFSMLEPKYHHTWTTISIYMGIKPEKDVFKKYIV
jgi:hypothetical protein